MEEDKNLKYIAGVFDGGGNIYYKTKEYNNKIGYIIEPMIAINVGNALHGYFDKFLINNQIMYSVSENGNTKRIEIDSEESIKKFLNLLIDYTVQHRVCSDFLLNVFYPKINNKLECKNEFLKLLRTIEMTQPRRKFSDNVKYSTCYFDKKWNDKNCGSAYELNQELKEIDIGYDYISGFFDGCGKIRPVVIESKSYNSEYSVSIRVNMVSYWMKENLLESIKNQLENDNIEFCICKNSKKYAINITEIDSVDMFLHKVQDNLISNYESAIMTRDKIVQAVKDDYNQKRQGVHDIVQLYEHIDDTNSDNTKYTSEFFRNQWDDVEKIEFDR